MFSKKPTVKKLRQYKTIRISGMRFTIRKLNPLVDFPPEKMPQIFTSYIARKNVEPVINEATLRKNQKDMESIISAGLVKPEVGKDAKIEDFMADTVLALRLYTEILVHSLNMFRGIKGVFFSARTRRLFYTEYRKNMERLQTK